MKIRSLSIISRLTWGAGVPVCATRSGRPADARGGQRGDTSAQEEEETAPLVGALPQDPTQEGRLVQPRLQLHAVRPPRSAVRRQLPLRRRTELLRKVLPVQLRL